jgi:hypothetical protein
MNEQKNDKKTNRAKLWLDEEFRRLYPLSALRLRDLAEQQQEELAHRQYIETLGKLHAVADKLSKKDVLEFRLEDFEVQGG